MEPTDNHLEGLDMFSFAGSSYIPCLCLAANFTGTYQRSTSECSTTKAERVASISLEQQSQVSYQGLAFATLTALLLLILAALLSVGCTKLTSFNSSSDPFIVVYSCLWTI